MIDMMLLRKCASQMIDALRGLLVQVLLDNRCRCICLFGLTTIKPPNPYPHHPLKKAYQAQPQIPHKADKRSYPALPSIEQSAPRSIHSYLAYSSSDL
jgi:hypothetical protein